MAHRINLPPVTSRRPLSRRLGHGVRLGALLIALLGGWTVASAQTYLHAGSEGPAGQMLRTEGAVQGLSPQGLIRAGDLLEVGARGRATFSIGPNLVRLGEQSRLRVLVLDGARVELQLLAGSMALQIVTPDTARATSVQIGALRATPFGPGLFRFDADRTQVGATAWRSDLEVSGPQSGLTLRSGQHAELAPDGYRWRITAPADDRFARWAMVEEAAPGAVASTSVPPLVHQEDLARHGEWVTTSEWGSVWMPRQVDAGWAPYQQGQWTWISPWGWTWVDAAPWGVATVQAGRWVSVGPRWGWVPGVTEPRAPSRPPQLGQQPGAQPGVPMVPRPWTGGGTSPGATYSTRPHLPDHARHEREADPDPYRPAQPGGTPIVLPSNGGSVPRGFAPGVANTPNPAGRSVFGTQPATPPVVTPPAGDIRRHIPETGRSWGTAPVAPPLPPAAPTIQAPAVQAPAMQSPTTPRMPSPNWRRSEPAAAPTGSPPPAAAPIPVAPSGERRARGAL